MMTEQPSMKTFLWRSSFTLRARRPNQRVPPLLLNATSQNGLAKHATRPRSPAPLHFVDHLHLTNCFGTF